MTAPAAPAYVHRILDAYLSGDLLDLGGAEVPDDVRARLEAAFTPSGRPDGVLAVERGESPARGWVGPDDDPVRCDACGAFCHYWELHHLDPVGWGGPDSRALADRQVVWVRVDAQCHAVGHMVMDVAKREGGWPESWLAGFATPVPHGQVELARRGWQAHLRRLAREREAAGLAEAVARDFHERYEELAPRFGYETRPESAVPWHRVPAANRDLMVATAERVLADFGLRQQREAS